jgi:hypothetical protein
MMPKIRLATEPEDAPDTSVWSEDGAAGAETTIVPPPTVAGAPALAWSEGADDAEQPERQSWIEASWTAAVILLSAAAAAFVIGIVGLVALHHDEPAAPAPSTMAASAIPSISTAAPAPTVTVQVPAPTVTVQAAPPSPPAAPTQAQTLKTSDPDVVPPTAAPSFSGRYTMTETVPDSGQTVILTWAVTPCGDGCANIAVDGSSAQAHLVNGFWRWDTDDVGAACEDGSKIYHAGSGHYVLDATTLRGTAHFTWRKVCPGQSGDPDTNTIVLTRAGT